MIKIEPASKLKPEDVLDLADNMRAAEADEVWASNGWTPLEALTQSLKNSVHTLSIWNCVGSHRRIVGICGLVVRQFLADKALVWMLTSNEIDGCSAREYLKFSKIIIGVWLERFGTLYNFVDARHIKSIRWIKACGGHIFEPSKYGYEGKPFHYFEYRRV